MQAGKNRDIEKNPKKTWKYAKTQTWTQVEKANRHKANRHNQKAQKKYKKK